MKRTHEGKQKKSEKKDSQDTTSILKEHEMSKDVKDYTKENKKIGLEGKIDMRKLISDSKTHHKSEKHRTSSSSSYLKNRSSHGSSKNKSKSTSSTSENNRSSVGIHKSSSKHHKSRSPSDQNNSTSQYTSEEKLKNKKDKICDKQDTKSVVEEFSANQIQNVTATPISTSLPPIIQPPLPPLPPLPKSPPPSLPSLPLEPFSETLQLKKEPENDMPETSNTSLNIKSAPAPAPPASSDLLKVATNNLFMNC